MPEIMSGPVTVDETVSYKSPGINIGLIGKAAGKLGRKKVPRHFYSNIRSHHILVKSVLGSVINGRTIPEEAHIVKFRDGRFTTSDIEEIIAIEDCNAYGVDIFDIDQMNALVEKRNVETILGLVGTNEAAQQILRERYVHDFLDSEKAAEREKAPPPGVKAKAGKAK